MAGQVGRALKWRKSGARSPRTVNPLSRRACARAERVRSTMSIMRRIAAALIAMAGPGCHLADSPDPVKCEPGQHAIDGHCAFDESTATTFVISPGEGGAACSVTPSSLTVAVGAAFEFRND